MSYNEPNLVVLNGFFVSGLSVRTKNTDEFNPATAKLPSLWQQFMASEIAENAVNSKIFGVYSDYESDAEGSYQVTAGVSLNDRTRKPGNSSVEVKPGDYLVFKDQGVMPEVVIKIWQNIWSYFAETQGYQRNFISDFELYSGSDEVAVYIGVNR
ncbi:Bacterial transcription activator, effector binding domain [Legionella massiliensis]|uniref:Bacterial transcription activator, effector binding domain n=1 Tax=Legionella massiliensis TaxID=1034943 RepID=A0A078KU91_9GAMM|nr:GyrI-like domain-containing protein [Legionella massiliensis]CDZ78015.1 Bacterial transcription activator, effector binding domain [Legionella massiliensis]CEE13753.1 Bacterial transcription activator, effector binding domain [Legionella massiliensis]